MFTHLLHHSMFPHTDARMAAPMTAPKDSLADGAPPLRVLHLSAVQQSTLVSMLTPRMVLLEVMLHLTPSMQPWLLKLKEEMEKAEGGDMCQSGTYTALVICSFGPLRRMSVSFYSLRMSTYRLWSTGRSWSNIRLCWSWRRFPPEQRGTSCKS